MKVLTSVQKGDRVIASYKTGTYIGDVVDLGQSKAAVQVLAVLKHPEQGDLHHPHETEVAIFHQRRALSHREIANMPLSTLRIYTGNDIPDYKESLANALNTEIEGLEAAVKYAQQALLHLNGLRSDYNLDNRE